MKYCIDTWFLVKISEEDKKAKEILRGSKNSFVIPSVVILEITRIGIHRGKKKKVDSIISDFLVRKNIEIINCNIEIARKAGEISASYGVPTVDSIVAATAILTKCHKLLSEDEHFELLHKKKVIKKQSW